MLLCHVMPSVRKMANNLGTIGSPAFAQAVATGSAQRKSGLKQLQIPNLSKTGPPSKNKSAPLLLLQRGLFSQKYAHPFILQYMLLC